MNATLSAPVTHEQQEGILLVRLERPTLDDASLDGMHLALDAAEQSDVDAVVLLGTSTRGTGFGVDLPWLLRGLDGEAEGRLPSGTVAGWLRWGQDLARRLNAIPCPTVGVMHGLVIGGALELMACVDLRVAATGTRIGLPELAKGLWPGLGGVARLRRQLPDPVLRDMLLTGRMLRVDTLKHMGFVSQVVAPDLAVDVALQLAREASRAGALATLAKQQLAGPSEVELDTDHAIALARLAAPNTRDRLRHALVHR